MISKIKALFNPNEEKAISSSSLVNPDEISKYSKLEKSLGYFFKEIALLKQALTHKSSIKAEDDPKGLLSNERLEFLGDAVIDTLVTDELYHNYLNHSEGQLSKIKSLLVSRKILGVVASRIELNSFIIKGKSEKKNEKNRKSSIESNAFEAVLGAIYIDGSIDDVKAVLKKLLFPNIDHFVNDVDNRNYKSRILELSQADGFGIPQYVTLAEVGPDHMKKFDVVIEVAGIRLGNGSGKNKKAAQQEAARIAVKKYSKDFIVSEKTKN